MTIELVLLVIALITFCLSAGGVGHPRVNLQSLGLALVVLAFVLRGR